MTPRRQTYQGNGWITVEERIKTEISDANLWRAVIDQAIEDLSQPKLRQAAVDWFASTAQGPGSFRWACDYLDLNSSAVWQH
jgi:hypothetical protein